MSRSTNVLSPALNGYWQQNTYSRNRLRACSAVKPDQDHGSETQLASLGEEQGLSSDEREVGWRNIFSISLVEVQLKFRSNPIFPVVTMFTATHLK